MNQPVPRLITSPQATQGVREPSRSPRQPLYLTVSSPTQKQPGPRISDTLTPQGPKRGRERDSLEVTHWALRGLRASISILTGVGEMCGTSFRNLAAELGQRSLRGPGLCLKSLQGSSFKGGGGESQESQAVQR